MSPFESSDRDLSDFRQELRQRFIDHLLSCHWAVSLNVFVNFFGMTRHHFGDAIVGQIKGQVSIQKYQTLFLQIFLQTFPFFCKRLFQCEFSIFVADDQIVTIQQHRTQQWMCAIVCDDLSSVLFAKPAQEASVGR